MTTKFKVCAMQENTNVIGLANWVNRYVGYTSRDENTFMNETKQFFGDKTKSEKFANLKSPAPSKLRVQLLGWASSKEEAEEKVNKFITKYDTINNGWNTELR